jgi:hypothetical protein
MTFKKKTILSLSFLALVIVFLKPGSSPTFWLGVFVFFQSVLLYLLTEENSKNTLMTKIILLVLSVLVGIFIVESGIYKDTFNVTNLEKNTLWERRELYRRELGRFGQSNFGNKFIEETKLILDKTAQKISESYEITHYFSTENRSFYSLLLIPFFAIGFIFMLTDNLGSTLYYLGLATFGAIIVPPNMTYWLFVPLVNLGLLFGVKRVLILVGFKKHE